MITILHNPRCSKSREALKLIESSGKDFNIINYLKQPLDFDELKSIIKKLGIKPLELIRTNESIWKENYKSKAMSDKDLIQAMVNNPKLIERPIVMLGNTAIIGRPPTMIKSLLKE